MAASAHGCDISLSELCRRYPPAARGVTVKQLVNVAGALGFDAHAVVFEPEGLRELFTPAVLHWQGHHFVLVTEVGKDGITVLDPAWGRRYYKEAELPNLLTGVAIEIRPTDRVFVGSLGKRQSAFRPILDEFKPLKTAFGKLTLVALYLEALVILLPLLFWRLLDGFARTTPASATATIAWALLLGTLAIWALRMYRSMAVMYLSTEVKHRFISRLIPRLLSKPFGFFRQRTVADLIYQMTGAEHFRNMVTDEAVSVFVDGLLTIVVLLFMLHLNPRVALVTLMAAILVGACRLALTRRETSRYDEIIHSRGSEAIIVHDTLRAAKTLKLFGKEHERAELWERRVRQTLRQETRYSRSVILANVLPAAASELVVVGTLAAQILFTTSVPVTIGSVFALYVYQKLVLDRCQAIASRGGQLKLLRLYMARMADVLEEPAPAAPALGKEEPAVIEWPRVGRVLDVEGVSFEYGADSRLILENASLTVDVGEFLGIYGRSGVGKTTFLEILLGVRDANAGAVKWAGVLLKHMDQRTFRRRVVAVSQDDVVLAGTIAENIAFFDENPDWERIQRAARAAKLEEVVLEMPLRYSSGIGEGGCALSGGQRQRLVLARALYATPEVLIIDEGTNELDAGTEAEIYLGLKRLGMTLIVVAHREETLNLAHRTVMLEGGCFSEGGRGVARPTLSMSTRSSNAVTAAHHAR